MKSTRTIKFVSLLTTCLTLVFAAAFLWTPAAHATIGVCDTAGPIEVESTPRGRRPYATLGAAFADINAGVHTGTIWIEVCGDTTEPAAGGAERERRGFGLLHRISISPAGGAARLIAGRIAGPLIDLNGADNVTIDGLNSGGDALTIDNTLAAATPSTIRFIADASSNMVRNCTIKGAGTGAALGTIFFATGTATGNINDTITGNTITSSGSNLPTNAIYSAGTSTLIANSGILISNNDIQDYFNAASASSGILVASNSASWTITGNKLFQTAARNVTTASQHRAINIITASAGGYTVSNNTIGYASAAGTGYTTYTGTVAGRFFAIEMTVGASPVSEVQGNTVTAISLSTSSGASAAPGVFAGISILGGSVNVGTSAANIIGTSSGAVAITVVSTTSGAYIGGIYATTATTVTIQNNIIGGFNTGGTATIGYVFRGIDAAGTGGNFTISGNTIGNTSTANAITVGTSGTTTAITSLYGIANAATGTISITGNTIANCLAAGTGSGLFYGINNAGSTGTTAITANNVLVNRNNGTGGSYGIYSSAAAATVNINNNVVRSFTLAAASGTFAAIQQAGAVTAAININNNALGDTTGGLVSYATASTFSGTLYGIYNSSAGSASSLSIQTNDIRGISYLNAASGANYYIYNSGAALTQTISGNTFTNLVINTTGSTYFMYNSTSLPANGAQTVNGNSIVGSYNRTGTTGTLYLWYSNSSSPSTATKTHTNNNFSNITVAGTTGISGWVETDGGAPNKTIQGNTFSNWTGAAALIYGMNISYTTTGTITSNTITNITGGGVIYGINLGSSGTLWNVTSNTINNLSSSGGTVYGRDRRQHGDECEPEYHQHAVLDLWHVGGGLWNQHLGHHGQHLPEQDLRPAGESGQRVGLRHLRLLRHHRQRVQQPGRRPADARGERGDSLSPESMSPAARRSTPTTTRST